MKPDLSATYWIFGRPIRVNCEDPRMAAVLRNELSLYEHVEGEPPEFEVTVTLGRSKPRTTLRAINPALHQEFASGFCQTGTAYSVEWSFAHGKPTRAHLRIHEVDTAKRLIYRMANIQNSSRSDMAGQILHEGVLLPHILMCADPIALHAAAVCPPGDNRPILLGGTGGVGKTSLMMALCLRHHWRFLADDIAVISRNGVPYPNLAFPKIYGYNVDAFPEIKPAMVASPFTFDGIHWRIHRTRGAQRVRRRLSPNEFNASASTPGPCRAYIVLARSDVDTLSIERMDPDRAAIMSVQVLITEFSKLGQHLAWSNFNRLLLKESPWFENLHDRWLAAILDVLKSRECYVLKIPLCMNHSQLLAEGVSMLRQRFDPAWDTRDSR